MNWLLNSAPVMIHRLRFLPHLQFSHVPEDYDSVYLEMARRGARVLALGYKTLGILSHQQVRGGAVFLKKIYSNSTSDLEH